MAALSSLILGGLVLGQTALNAYGQHQQAKAAKKMGKYQGEAYDTAAQDARARGEEQANVVGAQARQLTGSQRVALAAQGIDASSGSARDVISNDQRLAQLNQDQIRLNAAREAFGFTEQGRLARLGARNEAAGYTNQMYSTLLGGATQLYSVYRAYGMNRTPRAAPPAAASGGFTGESRPDTGYF